MQREHIRGLDGFRFMCHVWVVAYHCLPSLPIFHKFLGNGDSGVFFVISGFLTELSLQRYWMTKHGDYYRSTAKWIGRRLFLIASVTWTIALTSYYIFPVKEARGRPLLFNVLTFTLPFRERFDADRLVWNSDPPVWFVEQCLWLWLLHWILFPASLLQKRPWPSLIALGLWQTGLLYYFKDEVIHHTGWSFHPLIRIAHYFAGVWVAKFSNRHRAPPPFMPDLGLAAIFLVNCTGPERYSKEWMSQWVWRTQIIIPSTMLMLHGLNHRSYSLLKALYQARVFNRLAPGYTNFLSYLIHFPLVWRPSFGKNQTMNGEHSLFYCIALWYWSLWLNDALTYLATKAFSPRGGNTSYKARNSSPSLFTINVGAK